MYLLCNVSANTNGSFYFPNREIDIGQIPRLQKKIVVVFNFSNTSTVTGYITEVKTGCNCVIAHYPKYPIKPNSKEKIYITLDTSGISGNFRKNILVRFSDRSYRILYIVGNKS